MSEYLPVYQYIPIIRERGKSLRWNVVIKLNRNDYLSKSKSFQAKNYTLNRFSLLKGVSYFYPLPCLPVKAEPLLRLARQGPFVPLSQGAPDV
jgi:hypothetical protein